MTIGRAGRVALQLLGVSAVHDEATAERRQRRVDPLQVLDDLRAHRDVLQMGDGVAGHGDLLRSGPPLDSGLDTSLDRSRRLVDDLRVRPGQLGRSGARTGAAQQLFALGAREFLLRHAGRRESDTPARRCAPAASAAGSRRTGAGVSTWTGGQPFAGSRGGLRRRPESCRTSPARRVRADPPVRPRRLPAQRLLGAGGRARRAGLRADRRRQDRGRRVRRVPGAGRRAASASTPPRSRRCPTRSTPTWSPSTAPPRSAC